MATTIRDLLVKLGVDSDDATAGVDQLESSMGSLIEVMLGAVAAAAAVAAAIAAVATSAAAAGDAIDKGAQAAAISNEAYQELAFIAGQMGTDIDTVTKALGKQTAALAQVQEGTGTAADAMADLGITYADLEGLSADEQFLLTADAMAGVTDEQERLRIATAIYGEDMAQQLMPLLSAGGENLGDLAEQAHNLGIVMSDENVAASVAFTDILDELWAIVEGIKNTIGLALLPTLTDMMTQLRDWWTANQDLIGQKLDEYLDVVVAALTSVWQMFGVVNDIVNSVFGGWEPIFAAAAALVAALGVAMAVLAGAQAWAAISAALAALGAIAGTTIGPIIAGVAAVVAVVVGLGLAIDDLITFLNGGDSAIGRFLDTFRESEGPLGAMARGLETMIGIGMKLWEIIKTLGAIWWEVFQRTTLPALKIVGAALFWLAEVAFAALGLIWDNVIGPMWEMFSAALDFVLAQLEALMPIIDAVLGAFDSVLGAVGGVLGIDLAPGGGDGEEAAGGLTEGAGALFAPSAEEAGGATGAASVAAAASSSATTVAGNTYTINGVGLSVEEAQALIDASEQERARATSAALEGGEV